MNTTTIPFSLAALLLCSSLTGLLGCNESQNPLERLNRASLNYYDGLRWKQFGESARVIPPLHRQEFIQAREAERESFFVVGYEVNNVEYSLEDDQSPERAKIIVQFTWYRLPSLTLEKTRMLQSWHLQDDEWMLVKQEELTKPADRRKDEEPRPPSKLL